MMFGGESPSVNRSKPPLKAHGVISVGNTAKEVEDGCFRWTLFVRPSRGVEISEVILRLHPTFKPNVVKISEAPWEYTATGWGTFTVGVECNCSGRTLLDVKHDLEFDPGEHATNHPVELVARPLPHTGRPKSTVSSSSSSSKPRRSKSARASDSTLLPTPATVRPQRSKTPTPVSASSKNALAMGSSPKAKSISPRPTSIMSDLLSYFSLEDDHLDGDIIPDSAETLDLHVDKRSKGEPKQKVSTSTCRSSAARQIVVGNTAVKLGEKKYEWTMFVEPSDNVNLSAVTFKLHPTFVVNRIELFTPPWKHSSIGWGTFAVGVECKTDLGVVLDAEHMLDFKPGRHSSTHTLGSRVSCTSDLDDSEKSNSDESDCGYVTGKAEASRLMDREARKAREKFDGTYPSEMVSRSKGSPDLCEGCLRRSMEQATYSQSCFNCGKGILYWQKLCRRCAAPKGRCICGRPFEDGASRISNAVEWPKYWRGRHTLDGRPVEDVLLEPDDDMIAVIQGMLTQTWRQKYTRDRSSGHVPSGCKVLNVLRCENAVTFEKLWKYKSRVRSQRGGKVAGTASRGGIEVINTETSRVPLHDLDTHSNEVYLFHGTSPNAADAIATSAFKIDKAGTSTGTMFGPGLYLAENASKADEYSKEGEGVFRGQYAMLICRAVLGKVLVVKEPGDYSQNVRRGACDSICGDRLAAVGTFREFILFDEDAACVEYIAIYKRVYD